MRVFIASSKEGLDVAYAVQENLAHIAEVTVWSQGVFDLSEYTLEDIVEQVSLSDFGIFIFSFEDLSVIRNEKVKTTRDNVLLELGLFIGYLGRKRCFILMPKTGEKLHLPTDLLGIKPAFYDPYRSDKNLVAAVGPASNQIARSMAKQGRLEKIPDILTQQIIEAGLTAFYSSRKGYAKYRTNAFTIGSYIATANHSVHIVSINLMTGMIFDDLCSILKEKIQRNKDFLAVISLLNPWKTELMLSISQALNMGPEKLAKSIKTTLSDLLKVKHALPKEAQDRFEIRVHDTIPFGSAIIIDGNTEKGKIQIETKAYKAPIGKSFGFEISYKSGNDLFVILRDGYLRLIAEGCTYESMLEFLKNKKQILREKNEKI